jgi:hypothetical protein
MSRRSQPAAPAQTPGVRQLLHVELLRDHYVNGQRFTPGTVLCLPASCASNLVEADAAKIHDPEHKNPDTN